MNVFEKNNKSITAIKTIIQKDHFENEELNYTYKKIKALEVITSNTINNVAKSQGNYLIGQEYSLKSIESIKDKLERIKHKNLNKEFNEKEELLKFKDIIRYTQISSTDNIINTANNTIDALTQLGYVHTGTSNFYKNPYPVTGYMGIHMNFITPQGQEIEIQIHSEESFEAKQKGHELYEKLRSVAQHSGVGEMSREETIKEINTIHQSVKIPYNYQELDNYSMDTQTKENIKNKRRLQTQINIEEKENCQIIFVSNDNKILYTGFEITFSDKSKWIYQNDLINKEANLFSLTKNGDIISSNRIEPVIKLNIDGIINIKNNQEQEHNNFMKKNNYTQNIDEWIENENNAAYIFNECYSIPDPYLEI